MLIDARSMVAAGVCHLHVQGNCPSQLLELLPEDAALSAHVMAYYTAN